MSREVPVPEGDEAQSITPEELGQGQEGMITDSIMDHLVPQVSSLNTPKEMFDSLTKLFEGKNINQNMNLRKQLKNVKMQNAETIQSYFARVSQIKEQLVAVEEEVENAEVVIATLNGLPGSWDSFM